MDLLVCGDLLGGGGVQSYFGEKLQYASSSIE
jgi:hypothetical protein